MKFLLAAVSLAALLAVSASAQTGPPVSAVPAVGEAAYPGAIRLEVDGTDVERRVFRVRQTIPVTPGPLTLLYPQFLPGNHAPTGPIQLLAGLTLSGGGQPIPWTRDPVQPHAFHLQVPAGVTEVVAEFQWLTQPDGGPWRVVMTADMLNLQWEKALLYPAGYAARRITVQPSLRLPQGWNYGVALDTRTFTNGLAEFVPTDLETLVDSPVFAGRHYRRVELDPGGRQPVRLNIVADTARGLEISEAQTRQYRNLVTQADRLFGSRHYDRYDFLLATTGRLGGIGLEHHRSSENTGPANFFGEGWNGAYNARQLLPHEYTHSWNGKFRRPADQMVANYNTPLGNSLLWVYEGQTEYWGDILAVRAGLTTAEEQRVELAQMAAVYETQPGRRWRSLQDTTNHNLLGYRTTNPWPSWMRGTNDYYDEGALVWLDVDTLIRERSGGHRSLDDFARAFFGGAEGVWTPNPYSFDDLVAALNTVQPYDWAAFLRARLDATGPDARAPLDGLARSGWRLTYVDTLTDIEKRVQSGWANDFQYSLGFTLAGGDDNTITAVRWGGPFYGLGLGAGWRLMAVNDRAASATVLREEITAARTSRAPLRLILRNGDRYRTADINYTGGLRYPRLERIPNTPDRLSQIYAARTR